MRKRALRLPRLSYLLVFPLVFSLGLLHSRASLAEMGSSVSVDSAIGTTSETGIDGNTIEILRNELDIAELDIKFLLQATPPNRWKGWRYFAFQEAGAATLESGLILGIDDRLRQARHKNVTRERLEAFFLPQMIGQCISALGDCTELGINSKNALVSCKKHLNIGSVRKRARQIHARIEAQLAARTELLNKSNLDASEREVYARETELLKDLHDILFSRLRRSVIAVQRQNYTQNSFYVLDIAKNVTGAVGNLVNIQSQYRQRPEFGIAGNILTTVSGSFIAANPLLSRAVGKAATGFAGGDDTGPFQNNVTPDTLKQHLEKLRECADQVKEDNGKHSALLARIGLYETAQHQFIDYVVAQREENQKAFTAALGREGVGAIVGATKISLGVTGIIASDRYPTKPFTAAPMALGGTTAYAAGTALTLVDNLKIEVQREIRYQKNKRDNKRPRDILIQRQEALETVRASLISK